MPGIVGIVNREGAPCDRALIDTMIRAIAFRGPAGVDVESDGPACVARLHSRPFSRMKGDPASTERLPLTIAFDGRIDNRAELERRVRAPLSAMSDADLVLALYAREADEGFARIVGDFAAAIWNRESRTLTCARDTWGVRPLVYCEIGRLFAFASEVAALRALPGFDSTPDETMVAEHLAIDIRSGDRTLYRSVRRLEPAHVLAVNGRSTSVRRYWSYDATRALRLHRDEEYADEFQRLFRGSVLTRVDATGTTGCELSGGIDSSSVTAVAQRVAELPVEAFSLRFSGLACDEGEYIEQVVSMSRVRAHGVSPRARSSEELIQEAADLGDAPDLAHGAMHRAIYHCASASGVAVLLTGLGGDDWFQGSSDVRRLAELLHEGRLGDALRAGALRQFLPALRVLASESPAGPALRSMRRHLRRSTGKSKRPPWIASDLWDRSGAEAGLEVEPELVRGSPARIATLRNGASAWPVWGTERAERVAARYGVEFRHPFLDRRVREFGLALPEDQRLRDGMTRYVVRNAMRGLLPEAVRLRRKKAQFTPWMLAELRAPGVTELLEHLSIESRGWVDGTWLRKRYQSLSKCTDASAEDDLTAIWAISMAVSLEAWHRGLGP